MENPNIEWTDHTFSPWRGCDEVSPACDRCYAKTLAKRNVRVLGMWGDQAEGGTRVVASEAKGIRAIWNSRAGPSNRGKLTADTGINVREKARRNPRMRSESEFGSIPRATKRNEVMDCWN